jgi:hypothetical protein
MNILKEVINRNNRKMKFSIKKIKRKESYFYSDFILKLKLFKIN